MVLIDSLIVLSVFYVISIKIDQHIRREAKKKIESIDSKKTLASNGDDSFINGIMGADVGNDL